MSVPFSAESCWACWLSSNRFAISTKASPRLETFEDGSSFNSLNFCIKFAASDFFVYSICFCSRASKAKTAISSLASASSMTCSSFLAAWSHKLARFMLALVSINTAVLRPGASESSNQRDRSHPKRQQQQVVQPTSTRQRWRSRAKKHQRTEENFSFGCPTDQVKQKRSSQCEQPKSK